MAALLSAEAVTPEPPAERQGTCRICFERGSASRRLIKPCICDGSQKWICVECLRQSRTLNTGNPQAMTHCTTCHTPYRLVCVTSVTSDARCGLCAYCVRQFAKAGIVGLTIIQIVIFAMGLLIRSMDKHEWLVKWFHFPQVPGHEAPGGFLDAIRYHKTTYYVAGLICFFGLIGLICLWVLLWVLVDDCCPDRCKEGTCLCMTWIALELPGLLLKLVLIVGSSFVAMGLFTAIVATVMLFMHAAQDYAALQERLGLARDWRVQDLASPDDLGDRDLEAPSQPSYQEGPALDAASREQQAALTRQLTGELRGLSGNNRRPAGRAH